MLVLRVRNVTIEMVARLSSTSCTNATLPLRALSSASFPHLSINNLTLFYAQTESKYWVVRAAQPSDKKEKQYSEPLRLWRLKWPVYDQALSPWCMTISWKFTKQEKIRLKSNLSVFNLLGRIWVDSTRVIISWPKIHFLFYTHFIHQFQSFFFFKTFHKCTSQQNQSSTPNGMLCSRFTYSSHLLVGFPPFFLLPHSVAFHESSAPHRLIHYGF